MRTWRSLIGNLLNVAVVAFLLRQLLGPPNLCVVRAVEELRLRLFGDQPSFGGLLVVLAWRGVATRQSAARRARSRTPPRAKATCGLRGQSFGPHSQGLVHRVFCNMNTHGS